MTSPDSSTASAAAASWRERMDSLRQDLQALAQEMEQLRQLALGAAADGTAPPMLRAGAAELDERRHELRVRGEATRVTPGEFRLLRLLLGEPGRVFPRPLLLREVCGVENGRQRRNVDAHVNRLRHRLGPIGDAIEGVYGVGYRWNADWAPQAQEAVSCQ